MSTWSKIKKYTDPTQLHGAITSNPVSNIYNPLSSKGWNSLKDDVGLGDDDDEEGASENPEGGAEEEVVEAEDFASTSGIPQWAEDWIKGLVDKYGDAAAEGYMRSVADVGNAPALIEQERQGLNQQYSRDVQAPMMDAIKSAMNQLGSQGMVNSSTSGDWIKNVTAEAMKSAAEQQTASNTWASGAKLQNLNDRTNAYGSWAGYMGDLVGKTSKSYDPNFDWLDSLYDAGATG